MVYQPYKKKENERVEFEKEWKNVQKSIIQTERILVRKQLVKKNECLNNEREMIQETRAMRKKWIRTSNKDDNNIYRLDQKRASKDTKKLENKMCRRSDGCIGKL